MNPKYEITFIVDENSTNEDVKSAVLATGANIVSETEVGVRRFVYPIGKKTSGKYFAIEFEADSQTLVKIEKALKVNKSVIRYLIVKALRKPLVLKKSTQDEAPENETKAETVEVKEEAAESNSAEAPLNKPEEVTLEEVVENKPEELDQEEIEADEKAEAEAKAELKQAKKAEEAEPVIEAKPAVKAESPKKPAAKKKPVKAVKISAEELDSKLAELVSED